MSEKIPNLNNNSTENKETNSRTLEENSDHLIDKTLEDDPEVYKTVVVRDKSRTMSYLMRGSRLPISINMENFNIYIGSDHLNMQQNANISTQNLCAGFARLDTQSHKIIVEDFADWRKDIENNLQAKKAIALAIQRDLIT